MLPLLRFSPPLHPSALVVGACIPDAGYLLDRGGHFSHTPLGLPVFCLPLGLVALVWLEALVLPALSRSLPSAGVLDPARHLRPTGLPRSGGAWLWAAVSILLGASLHLLWDGFTHPAQWPASVLYPEVIFELGHRRYPLARVLQHTSSLLGTIVIGVWMLRRHRRLPASPPGRPGRMLAVMLPTLLGGAAGLLWRLVHPIDLGSMEANAWFLFWPAARGGMAGLTLGSVLALRPFRR